MRRSVFAIYLVLPLIAGCSTHTDTRIGLIRHWPKEPSFQITPRELEEPERSRLDCDAVYYAYFKEMRYLQPEYVYYRFWQNGRVLLNRCGHLPMKKDAENFTGATLGYYAMSDRELSIETFVYNPGKAAWDYLLSYGQVSDDGNRITLMFAEFTERGAEKRVPLVFTRHDLGELTREPDW